MNLSENTQKKKLLIVNCKNIELCLNVTEGSEIVKNPMPLLWKLDGLYGWVPIEVVKNEIAYRLQAYINARSNSFQLKFSWHQAYRLRQDVGETLEKLINE